jgi:hypothetical protein
MSVNRILVILLRQLGDTLMSTPPLRQVHRLHPHAEIEQLLQGDPVRPAPTAVLSLPCSQETPA